MRYELLASRILERAAIHFPNKEIVTRVGEGTHRYTYAEMFERTSRLGNALRELGVGPGDRVGTFAWNTYRHLEAYFAPATIGAVIHTINIRLAPDDMVYIINHAGDQVLLIDPDLAPVVEAIADRLTSVRHFVILGEPDEMSTTLPDAASSSEYRPADVDEYSIMGLCYTSATTGLPKGVAYSHRAVYLHTLTSATPDMIGVSERDRIMAIVPMFHANCWGFPYAGTMFGASQIFPGVRPDPRIICEMVERERVTISAGVPTIWIGVLDYLQRSGTEYDLSSLRQVISGGSAVPLSVLQAYRERLGVDILHAYGMTEAAPLISANRRRSWMDDLAEQERLELNASQGVVAPGVEMKLVDENGDDLSWDGEQRGELWFRGPWVADEYVDDERSAETFVDGWYHSGDIATIDAAGYIQIVDRVKDMVKSGGEWISSVDLESAIMAHPDVLEAAVIAIPDPQWQERPLACVVTRSDPSASLSKDIILDFIRPDFARWWLPDDVVFIDEIPKTSVGKFDKKVLRERFEHHR
ncbi:Long-chain-fatty-acid--CoA ligase [Geodia barretti]|uniref:Long-chain-fatty-acid--CoA ligase n=1 Tax=Geodia barretti TaxID=519541 RepID=A0AA35T091_GEOBA|nr:Long-chain-fatty-acid--CoA ligase [Geodia barretti]